MAAATHKGCCQICGRGQKLPGGRLSRHGYTVQWGFFAGICPGSGHLPFEQSKDLIEDANASALKEASRLDASAVDLQKPAGEPQATCHVYRQQAQCRQGEKAGYMWIKGRIERRPPRQGQFFVVITDQGQEFYIHSLSYRDTELDAATYQNSQFAKTLQTRAAQMREYAAWQEDRIKNWEPQPLRPI